MRSPFRFSPLVLALIVLSGLAPSGLAPAPAVAADFNVPAAFATIQAAVAAAEFSADLENYLNLTEPIVTTVAEIVIDGSFGPTRHLTLRPLPTATFDRATIASTNGSEPIIRLTGADNVTIQDLDILRNATNNDNLIEMMYAAGTGNHDVFLERCRVGSIWTTPGSAGWVYLKIQNPYSVTIRNSIFFSYVPGNFDLGIHAFGFADPDNILRLYNNDVADFRFQGIRIVDGALGSTIVLRNNVVSNHPTIEPEPVAYFSDVIAGVTVVTSHNTAFVDAGPVEAQAGAQSIILPGAATLLIFTRAEVDDAFHERTWDLTPPWDPNDAFFRLVLDELLHTGAAATNGQTVGPASPNAADIAVVDDWERDGRPSGDPLHTDRGADQIERGGATATDVGFGPASGARLWAGAQRNPSQTAAVLFRATVAGELRFEVFDLAGQRLHMSERSVRAGDDGVLEWRGAGRSGVIAYRVTLAPPAGPTAQAAGRIAIVR